MEEYSFILQSPASAMLPATALAIMLAIVLAIVLAGATGNLGFQIAQALLKRGPTVRALVRPGNTKPAMTALLYLERNVTVGVDGMATAKAFKLGQRLQGSS